MLTKTMKTMNLVKSKSQQIMKTIKSLTCLAAIALSFAACQKNEVSIVEKSNSTFTFTSAKPQLEGETRTEYTGSSIQWSKGDAIRMAFTVDGAWQNAEGDATSEDGAKLFASTGLSAASETAEFVIPTKFTGDTEGEHVFYAIYPSSAASENFKYAPSATVTIPVTQVSSASSFVAGADVMVGVSEKFESRPSSSDVIPLEWTRVVAHGDITLKGLQNTVEGETVTSIKLTAQDEADLVGYHYMDIETGSFTLPSSNTTANTVTIPGDNLTIDENGNVEFWISILPETITSLKVEVETSKAFYTREISGINLAFAQNKRNTLSIKMEGVERVEKAPVVQIIDNGDYVIACGEEMMIAASGNFQVVADLSTTTNVDGKLVVNEDALWTITYDAENEVYYVLSASANKYLNGTATGTNLKLVAEGSKTGFTGTKNDDGTYSLTVTASGTTRGIGYNYNNGSPRFGMYNVTASDQITDISIIPAVVDTTPSVTFAETSKTVSASATEVTFTYTSKYLTSTPEVTVVSDEDNIVVDVVTSDELVTVTLNENVETKEKTATLVFSCDGVDDVELSIIQSAASSGNANEYTYVFTSKDWNATLGGEAANWTSGKDGNSFVDGQGIQVTTAVSGANGTSPVSFNNVTKVIVTYNTNKSKGAGSINLTVGTTSVGTNNVAYSGSADGTSANFTTEFAVSGLDGAIKLTVNTTTNSIYIKSVEITAD